MQTQISNRHGSWGQAGWAIAISRPAARANSAEATTVMLIGSRITSPRSSRSALHERRQGALLVPTVEKELHRIDPTEDRLAVGDLALRWGGRRSAVEQQASVRLPVGQFWIESRAPIEQRHQHQGRQHSSIRF